MEEKTIFLWCFSWTQNYFNNKISNIITSSPYWIRSIYKGTPPDSRFPPTLWSSLPSLNAKRKTNGAESFHAHYNEQFYAAHPTIFIFLDVLSKIQTTTYVKVRTIHMPAVIRRSEMEKFSNLMDQYSNLQALTRSTDTSESDRLQILC